MSLVRKSLTSASAAILLSGGRFLLMAILARRFSSVALGQFAYAQWLVDIVYLVCAFGINGSASRYLAEYSNDPARKARFIRHWLPWAAGLPVLSAVGVVGGAWLSGLALSPQGYTMLAAWAMATGWWAMQTGALCGHQRFDLIFKANLAFMLVILPAVLLIPNNEHAQVYLFSAMALSALLASGFGIQQNITSLAGSAMAPVVEMPWSKIRGYTVNVWLTGLLGGLVWSRGELPLVHIYLGDQGVAQYTVALTLFFGAMQGIMLWVSGVAPHLTSEWGRGNKVQAIAIARKFSDVQILISSCIALLLACFGPDLLELIFGPAYRMSNQILVILVLGLITLSASAQNHLLQIDTDAKFTRNISLAGLIVLYSGASLMIPWLGLSGAAASRTFTMWGMFLVSMVFVWRSWGSAAISIRNTLVAICIILIPALAAANGIDHYGIRVLIGFAGLTALLLFIRDEDGRLIALDIANKGFSHLRQWLSPGSQTL